MRSFVKLALLLGSAVAVASTPAFAQDAPPPAAAAPATAAPAAPAPASAAPATTAPATTAPATTAPATTAPGSEGPATAVTVAAPPGSTVDVGAPAVSTDGTILVHVDSPKPVSLERRANPAAPWEHACDSPCDGRLPVGDQYRVVGSGMNDSNPFTLDGSKGDRAVLLVAPGTKTKQTIGEGLLIGGAVVLVGSIVIGAALACPSCTFNQGVSTDTQNTDVIAAATTFGVLGLATGIFGAAWMVDNAHSRVSGAVQAAPPARGALDPTYVAGMRQPMPSFQAFALPVVRF